MDLDFKPDHVNNFSGNDEDLMDLMDNLDGKEEEAKAANNVASIETAV